METNEKYGYPSDTGRQSCRVVCFDVDGTLITMGMEEPTPRYEIIQLLKWFQQAHKVFVWSGGGIDYAQRWVQKLGLGCEVIDKGSIVPDIAFDDMDGARLGRVTVRV